MHPVHTLMRRAEPPIKARTRWMLGFQRRFVRRWECDTDMPQEGRLPHTSHTAAMIDALRLGPAGRNAGVDDVPRLATAGPRASRSPSELGVRRINVRSGRLTAGGSMPAPPRSGSPAALQ